jgi:esterase/lipase superfamily enzyme
MNREYQKWKSPSLGRDMEMLIFGKEGTPVIIFPQGQGSFFEWEDTGGLDTLQEQIEKGYNQFFCVDNVADESFLNEDVDPYVRVMRENQYEMYILDEVLPFISEQNTNPYLILAGAGMGAYHSLKMALKQPDLFHKVIGMSGNYDINVHLDGFKDDNSYYNNPIEFIPNLNDEKILKAISAVDIRLISYLNDPNREATRKMSDTLWMKFINHNHFVWEEETQNPWKLFPGMLKDNLI